VHVGQRGGFNGRHQGQKSKEKGTEKEIFQVKKLNGHKFAYKNKDKFIIIRKHEYLAYFTPYSGVTVSFTFQKRFLRSQYVAIFAMYVCS